jgi:hypothetical protein
MLPLPDLGGQLLGAFSEELCHLFGSRQLKISHIFGIIEADDGIHKKQGKLF